MIITALIILPVLIDCSRDVSLQDSEGLFGHFFPAEVLADDVIDQFGDVFISLCEVFVELVADHMTQLFPLLDSLCLLDC